MGGEMHVWPAVSVATEPETVALKLQGPSGPRPPSVVVVKMESCPLAPAVMVHTVDCIIVLGPAPGDVFVSVVVSWQAQVPMNESGALVRVLLHAASMARTQDDLTIFRMIVSLQAPVPPPQYPGAHVSVGL